MIENEPCIDVCTKRVHRHLQVLQCHKPNDSLFAVQMVMRGAVHNELHER